MAEEVWGIIPGEKEAQKFFISLHNCLKVGCSPVGVNLFSQVASDRTRRNVLKLQREKIRLDLGKNFFTETFVRLEQTAQGSGGIHPWNCSKNVWMRQFGNMAFW